jgi:hypothetical protein
VQVKREPTVVCVVPQGVASCLVQNRSRSTVFLGGHDVTNDGERQGFLLDPGESITVPAFEDDASALYAVTDAEDTPATVVFLVSS